MADFRFSVGLVAPQGIFHAAVTLKPSGAIYRTDVPSQLVRRAAPYKTRCHFFNTKTNEFCVQHEEKGCFLKQNAHQPTGLIGCDSSHRSLPSTIRATKSHATNWGFAALNPSHPVDPSHPVGFSHARFKVFLCRLWRQRTVNEALDYAS